MPPLSHATGGTRQTGYSEHVHHVRQTARDFRNRENFKAAIYFRCGGLDVYPH